MKYNYLMSSNYCSRWNTLDAIREILANALDSGDSVEVYWVDGVGFVKNNGILSIDKLLIGESSKRDNSGSIGQFGEGFKIAALILARNGKKFKITSGNKEFSYFLEANTEFDKDILCVETHDREFPTLETCIEFDCSEAELEEAKKLFRNYNSDIKDFGDGILDAPGDIYVLGVKISHIENKLLFGYDFSDKAIVNRDRTIVNLRDIDSGVRTKLKFTSSEEVITRFLTCDKD